VLGSCWNASKKSKQTPEERDQCECGNLPHPLEAKTSTGKISSVWKALFPEPSPTTKRNKTQGCIHNIPGVYCEDWRTCQAGVVRKFVLKENTPLKPGRGEVHKPDCTDQESRGLSKNRVSLWLPWNIPECDHTSLLSAVPWIYLLFQEIWVVNRQIIIRTGQWCLYWKGWEEKLQKVNKIKPGQFWTHSDF
jgi:hypothetical protein